MAKIHGGEIFSVYSNAVPVNFLPISYSHHCVIPRKIELNNIHVLDMLFNKKVAAFRGMHVRVTPRNIAIRDYQKIVTTGQTDAGQSDPYLRLCFAGDTIMYMHWLYCWFRKFSSGLYTCIALKWADTIETVKGYSACIQHVQCSKEEISLLATCNREECNVQQFHDIFLFVQKHSDSGWFFFKWLLIQTFSHSKVLYLFIYCIYILSLYFVHTLLAGIFNSKFNCTTFFFFFCGRWDPKRDSLLLWRKLYF